MRSLARWCFSHCRLVLVAWLALAAGLTLLHSSAGSGYSTNFNLKQTESVKALNLLQANAPKSSGSSDQIVLATRTGKVTDAGARQRVAATLTRVSHLPHVGTVESPYAPNAAGQISEDATVAFATVTFDQESPEAADVQRLVDVAKTAGTSNLQVELGGDAIQQINQSDAGGLPIGLGAAALVLLIVFGSLWAAALPLIAAGFALATGIAAIGLLSSVISMPDFSTQLALLLGLGVGVDYALFIVTRYRQGLMRGLDSQQAAEESLDTSGRGPVRRHHGLHRTARNAGPAYQPAGRRRHRGQRRGRLHHPGRPHAHPGTAGLLRPAHADSASPSRAG